MSEQRAAEVAKKNAEFEARGERIAAAEKYRASVPKEQRMRAAIETLATSVARERGMSAEQARRMVVDAVQRGENQRGGRR